MPLNEDNSTRLGSIISRRSASGEQRHRRQATRALMHTLFPEPVAPAMSRWGSLARSQATAWPDTSRPRASASGASARAWNCSDSMTPRRPTTTDSALGTSSPTTALPGTGASMRMGEAASASARSLDSAWMRLTLILARLTFPCRSRRST